MQLLNNINNQPNICYLFGGRNTHNRWKYLDTCYEFNNDIKQFQLLQNIKLPCSNAHMNGVYYEHNDEYWILLCGGENQDILWIYNILNNKWMDLTQLKLKSIGENGESPLIIKLLNNSNLIYIIG